MDRRLHRPAFQLHPDINFYDLYSKSEDDILLDAINELKEETKKAKAEYEKEIEKSSKKKDKQKIKKKLETIKDTWEYMTNEEKRTIILSVVEKIVVSGEDINIYYRF